MMTTTTSEKWDLKWLRCREPIAEEDEERHPGDPADDVIDDELGVVHRPDAATNGAKVRTTGTNRAMMIVLPPYFS